MEQFLNQIQKVINAKIYPPDIESTLNLASNQIVEYLAKNKFSNKPLSTGDQIRKEKIIANMIFSFFNLPYCYHVQINKFKKLDKNKELYGISNKVKRMCLKCKYYRESDFEWRGKIETYSFCNYNYMCKRTLSNRQRAEALLEWFVITRIDNICGLVDSCNEINLIAISSAPERSKPLYKQLWKLCQIEIIEKLKPNPIFRILSCNLLTQKQC